MLTNVCENIYIETSGIVALAAMQHFDKHAATHAKLVVDIISQGCYKQFEFNFKTLKEAKNALQVLYDAKTK